MTTSAYLTPIELLERYRANTLVRDRDRALRQANEIDHRYSPEARDLRDGLLADVGALEICMAEFSAAIRKLRGSR